MGREGVDEIDCDGEMERAGGGESLSLPSDHTAASSEEMQQSRSDAASSGQVMQLRKARGPDKRQSGKASPLFPAEATRWVSLVYLYPVNSFNPNQLPL